MRRLESTYKELKPTVVGSITSEPLCLESTYKELKHSKKIICIYMILCLESTYKELKLIIAVGTIARATTV